MRILLDIGHPAHVHLYRNFYFEMTKRGHEISITVKELPAAITLLDHYGMPYLIIGRRGRSIASKGFNQLKFNLKIFSLSLRSRIEIGLGSSITLAHVSRITPMKSIVFDDDDDEVQPLMTRYGHPFAHSVVSPNALAGSRKKHATTYYAGYHELAYLHPYRFKPDPSVLAEAGLIPGEKFFIMRFNAFTAHHDIGAKGLSMGNKMTLVSRLLEYGKVLITTEDVIEPELEQFRMRILPHRIHSLLSYATMLIGDSQTMTSESAVLGTPSLRCNSFAGRISYLEEEEKKYGLTYAFTPDNFTGLLAKLNDLMRVPDLREEWHRRRDIMLNDKIDVTAFMVWFVENFPGSKEIISRDPEFQFRFK